jgi:hypothetical protein
MCIRDRVEKVLHEVYGRPLMFEALIDETIEVNENNTPVRSQVVEEVESSVEINEDKKDNGENMINNLLKAFGGKIVK